MIQFNFYGIAVSIETDSHDLECRLSKDFSYFRANSTAGKTPSLNLAQGSLKLRAFHSEVPKGLIPPNQVAIRQSQNSITYEANRIRYNDYYGEALSIFDYKAESADIYSSSIERLHEITFLLALSRVEKKLDLNGFHKIHAFGVQLGETTLVCQMPMKGGKTTLFLALLEDPEVRIISDDTPLIDRQGQVYPFPIRVGVENLPSHMKIPEPALYSIERKHYGKKNLIDLSAFPNSIGERCRKVILMEGVRTTRAEPRIVALSRISMVQPLMKNMVVGVGLPMILEYFLETGAADFIRKARIVFSRAWTAMRLVLRSKNFRFELSSDRALNTALLKKVLQQMAREHSRPRLTEAFSTPPLESNT